MNANALSERIQNRTARVTVIGQGYVGLPLAIAFAHAGYKVTGLDSSPEKVDSLNQGRSPIPDVPHEELQKLRESGHYTATRDFAVLADSDVAIICVPTPLRKTKDPDISYVMSASEEVAQHLHPGQLIVLESTTYPGTTEEILLPLFSDHGGVAGVDFFLAFSPERIDPANPKFKVRDIPKVVGGVTHECSRLAASLYRQIVPNVLEVSSPRVAEMAKLYENVFRNVNIALANELALMCHRLGVNTREVIDAAATKPFGFMPFHPGPGVGGHCIGIDSAYLAWKMKLNGYDARFIHLAEEINQSMPARVVQMLSDALNKRQRSLNGAKVLALGVAYKPNVGDVRESPALEVIHQLQERGADVCYADPHVPKVAFNGTQLDAVVADEKAYRDADCVVILTDHSEFDYKRIASSASLVVDTRNATWGILNPKAEVIRL
ncbi:MAG TPA: nucleotide sugar dehydrogenase [Gammaproteobacteria bacterium]|jgi:UDP-N-acetyl-D-glucosamine dehydrogenase|nr:nucleotide sugar dehydrogenase [Gammaproteobacteria bacterium]